MKNQGTKYYPTILGAIHLVILYIFIQAVVDFPLALWDYFKGTELLYNPVKNLLLGVGSILFILLYAYKKAKTKVTELFPIRKFNPLIILPMILFLMAAHIFLTEVNTIVQYYIPPPDWFWELFDQVIGNNYDNNYMSAFWKVVIIAPIVEESIFRGIIMRGFMKNYSNIVAIIVSALLFALFHLNPWQFPATFTLGLLLGWIMVITRNIFACVAGHAINNLLVLLTLQYSEQIDQSSFFNLEPKTQFIIGLLTAVFSLLIIGVFHFFKTKKTT